MSGGEGYGNGYLSIFLDEGISIFLDEGIST
jgi:hypothetical protein